MKIKSIFTKLKVASVTTKIVLGVALIAVIGLLTLGGGNGAPEILGEDSAKPVKVLALGTTDFSGRIIKASGKITSSSEANISPKSSGSVERIFVQVGENVSRGQILIALGNNDLGVQVAQAGASVLAAETALENTLISLRDSVESAYNKTDDILRSKINPLFDKTGTTRNFGIQISQGSTVYYIEAEDGNEQNINQLRYEVESDLLELGARLEAGSTAEELIALASFAENILATTNTLLNQIAGEVNRYDSEDVAVQPVYDAYKNDISGARTSSQASLSAIRSARQAHNSAVVNLTLAKQQFSLKNTDAPIAQFQGNDTLIDQVNSGLLASAYATLGKTYIRAPFAGNVIALDAKVGEFVSPGRSVASMVSSAAKHASVFLSVSDAVHLSPGDRVVVASGLEGRVLAIAQGLAQETGKVEVTIALNGNEPAFVGDFVNVEIYANKGSADDSITLPLKAVKAKANGPVVYVIDESGVARETVVVTGDIVGEGIQIVDGLFGNEDVALSALGLKDGDQVESIKD